MMRGGRREGEVSMRIAWGSREGSVVTVMMGWRSRGEGVSINEDSLGFKGGEEGSSNGDGLVDRKSTRLNSSH
jgi:hypothetical protein